MNDLIVEERGSLIEKRHCLPGDPLIDEFHLVELGLPLREIHFLVTLFSERI
jgi:hypothetical protein